MGHYWPMVIKKIKQGQTNCKSLRKIYLMFKVYKFWRKTKTDERYVFEENKWINYFIRNGNCLGCQFIP